MSDIPELDPTSPNDASLYSDRELAELDRSFRRRKAHAETLPAVEHKRGWGCCEDWLRRHEGEA